MSDMI